VTDYAAYTGGPENTYAARHGNAAPSPGNTYARPGDAAPSPQIALQPIIDLDTGTVVAVSAPAPMGYITELESDVDRAILAAHATSQRETLLPLHVFLRAQTLTDDRSMDRLHQTLTSLGRRPGGVIISVSGLFGGMPPAEAVARLGRLRAIGYLIAIERVGDLPSRFVAEVAPSVLTLDPELSRATADPRRAALVDGLVSMGRRTGGHVLAPGIVDDDQLTRLRGLGVRLAQGPLLAPPDWRPGVPVTVRLGPRETDRLGPRVTEFMLPATVMPDDATSDAVFAAFNAEPNTTSVVLVDPAQRPRYTVDRTRFLLKFAGAYGHALHAHKPANRLADPPRPVPRTVPAIAALRAAGDDAARVYDDLVVVDEVGRCMGIARVGDLIRSLSELERRSAS
jgi:EAL domain-containing protein (putative c-di-GMP-specific phosphodiesterase class I)